MTNARKIPESYKETFNDIMVNMVQWRELTNKTEPNGCILWQGLGRHPQGYGMIMVWDSETGKRKMALAHRLAYKIGVDSTITPQDYIIQTCGNPLCVAPTHLFRGKSSADSIRLKKARGAYHKRGTRYAHKTSQKNHVYKHTVEQLIWASTRSIKDIQARYNLHYEAARRLRYLGGTGPRAFKWIQLIRHKYTEDGILKPGYFPELSAEFQKENK
jgi:hypothetical protein